MVNYSLHFQTTQEAILIMGLIAKEAHGCSRLQGSSLQERAGASH